MMGTDPDRYGKWRVVIRADDNEIFDGGQDQISLKSGR
jgi:hypothetical protein